MGKVKDKDRLRALDQIEAPDLRERIRSWEPRRPRTEPSFRRVGVALLALFVAVAGIAFAIWAFAGTPRSPQPRPAATVKNGEIAFVIDREGGNDIYLMEADGSNPIEMVKGRDPSWSPDGTQMAFRTGNPEKGGGLETSINVINADGTNLRTYAPEVLGEASGEAGPPVFSPDGTQIAFDTLGGIYVMNVDGTGLRRVTRYQGEFACYDLQPSWSPDGSRLVFAVLCDGGNEGIWMVNVDGTGRRQVLSGDETSEYYSPVWSPDGEKIAFEAVDWEGSTPGTFRYLESGIYVMDADGGNVTELLVGNPETDSYGGPAWSPDGSQIAFVSWSDEGSKIGVVNADGTNVRMLTDGSERVCCPAWQPVPVQQEAPEPSSSPSPIAVDARVAGLVRLEGIPGSVAVAEGSVWVATYDYENQQSAVVHIDATTNEVVATVPVDGVVYNLAADTNAVWVPAGAQPSVELLRIDALTHQVTGRVEGVHGPVVVDQTGVWAIEDGPDERDAAVVRIDPETLQIEVRVPMGESPFDMVTGAGSIWLVGRETRGSDVEAGDLLRIDATSGELTATIPIQIAGIWSAADDTGVWVPAWDPHRDDFKAFFIDASTNEVSGEPGDVYNFRPFAVADDRVWFISGPHDPALPKGGVCGLNISTRTVDVCAEPESVPNLPLARDPAAFDPATHSIWLGAFDKPWVTRIDVVPAGRGH